MRPEAQIAGIMGDEEQQPSVSHGAEGESMRAPATKLAASLSWLPGSPSSDAFLKGCQKLSARFKSVFAGVESAFAQNPKSENLLWLRNNAQQLTSAARLAASELGPLTELPVVSNKNEILPRVLAIAQGFVDEADSNLSKGQFTAFCLAFEET